MQIAEFRVFLFVGSLLAMIALGVAALPATPEGQANLGAQNGHRLLVEEKTTGAMPCLQYLARPKSWQKNHGDFAKTTCKNFQNWLIHSRQNLPPGSRISMPQGPWVMP